MSVNVWYIPGATAATGALGPRRARARRGADLRDGARRVLKLVVRANARRDKAPVLLEVREEVEQLKVVLRLCQDVKAFASFGAFTHAIEQVVAIAKQNEGWLRSQRQGHGQNRRATPAGPAAPGVP